MSKATLVKKGGKLIIEATAEEVSRRDARTKAKGKNLSAPDRAVLLADFEERLEALETWARLQGFTD